MGMGKLTWQHIVLVGIVVGAMFGATLMGKDFDTMALLAVLGGLGLVAAQQQGVKEQTQQVKEQTNGNITRLLDQNQKLMSILAVSPPIDPHALREINDQHMAAVQQSQQNTLSTLLFNTHGQTSADTVELPAATH